MSSFHSDIADAVGGVTDEAWAHASKHYDEDQLAALVSQIAIINAFNRANVVVQRPAGKSLLLTSQGRSMGTDPATITDLPLAAISGLV
ncbi:hypothetical protein BH20ACT4_BH20ACT4_03830 [soil metagenome]